MRQFIVPLILFVVSASLLSGCFPSPITSSNSVQPAASLEEKSGYSELSGTLQQQGSTFLLQTGAKTVSVESYSVDLSTYAGQTITVKGKYSGDTLFVEEIVP